MGRGIKKNLKVNSILTLLLIIFIGLTAIVGCDTGMLDDIEDKIVQDEIESAAKDLITPFSFLDASNPALAADVAATITGTEISIAVPYGTDLTALIATLILHLNSSVFY